MKTTNVKCKCENCRSQTALNSYRLNPRNWRKTYRRLCTPCRRKLGYALEYKRKERANQ